MMTFDGYVAALRAEGLRVVERPGARTRNTGALWTPAGTITHHTGPYSSVEWMLGFLENGRTDLAVPLTQSATGPDGTIYVCAWGAANHAGTGDSRVLDAVLADRVPPAPADTSDLYRVGGNRWFLGNEAIHPGDSTPWPAAQVDAMVRHDAAVDRLNGWTPNRNGFHKGWTIRKVDPVALSITAHRQKVADRLRPADLPPSLPGPADPKETDMKYIFRDVAGRAVLTDLVYAKKISAEHRVAIHEAIKAGGAVMELAGNDATYLAITALPPFPAA